MAKCKTCGAPKEEHFGKDLRCPVIPFDDYLKGKISFWNEALKSGRV